MLTRSVLKTTLLGMVLLSACIVSSCKKKPIKPDPAFAQFISAFTSGSVSAAGTIRVRFTDQFADSIRLNEPIAERLIELEPSTEGETFWIDNQTLEFRPKEWLDRGEQYNVKVHLDQIMAVPDQFRTFEFSFMVMQQFLDVNVENIRAYSNDDLTKMYIGGTLRTYDVCRPEEAEKTLFADEGGTSLPIRWTHSEDMMFHSFTVDSVVRMEQAQTVTLRWDGSPAGADQKGERTQEIPGLGDFKVFHFYAVQQPEQYAVLQFSDPLEPNQSLEGLIDIPGVEGERLWHDGNEVRVYPPYRISGETTILVHTGIKNIMGYPSKEEQSILLLFEELKPMVEIPDESKSVLPSSDGLVFPFRAVNLSAVDVRVIRIYENNIPQFLQVNDMNGSEEMRRVGRLAAKSTVHLAQGDGKDLSTWNTFYLDMNDLIKAEPGALYRVEIGFKQSYSLYPCNGQSPSEPPMQELQEDEDAPEDEFSYWDYFDEYDYWGYYDDYYGWDYDWDQTENPCDPAYYKSRRPVGKNILASDIGLIAKRGQNGSLRIYVNDIRSAKALSDVQIQLLNYQQQILFSGRSNAQGELFIEDLKGQPFLMIASRGSQKGYLKMDSNHALSLSTFDIGGSATQKGLKGFIYGERGVWRPGDTLFLSFMLEDELNTLPDIHPVHFELINPRGQVVQKLVRSKSENGLFAFTCNTNPDAETGIYTANVKVGGATFSKSLRIEAIKPNRLKLTLDFGKEEITALDDELKGTLEARWLHGAIAKNLKANVSVTFSQTTTTFERYKDYNFDDPIRSFEAEEQVIYDGLLDGQGKATIPLNVDLQDKAGGMVNANFSVKVFEESGDFSVDRFSIPYSPYSHLVGMKLPKGDRERGMLLTDTDHEVNVITVDASGKTISLKNLRWKVYKVQWRWWWQQNSDDLANYVGREGTIPIAEGVTNTGTDGKGSFRFQVNYPEWGRYLVRIEDEEGGHATGQTVYIDWPGWAGRAQRENPGGASMLMFTLDKEKYTPGEKCTITIPSSGTGRILVSVENGTRVLHSEWHDASPEQTVVEIPVTAEFAPNVYVHVTMIQPHSQTANDLPIRLYGVVPLFVDDAGSHLEPTISMKDELEPETPFEVRVCEKNGRGMSYTLAVVDDGLLDLTRFKTPDPWNHFYAREALGVSTYDMYDDVIGAFGTRLEKLLSIGGSEEGGGKGKNKANRFKPVVMYLGPFTLKPGECKTHKLVMPNYVGSVRVMVVAGKDLAYGNAEKTVPVKKPLMVLATLPRVLSPGEEVKLPVTVFAMDASVRDVKINVQSNELLKLNEPNERSVKFAQPGDLVENFSLKVTEKEGVGKVKVIVSSGNLKSTYEIELDVRSPNPMTTRTNGQIAESGGTSRLPFEYFGISGTNEAILEVSTIPNIDFGRRVRYLIHYPHGCVEQTTSAAFAQLYLPDVIDMDDATRKRIDEHIRYAVSRLAQFQTRGGGLTYWPGITEEDEWGTTYAGHFMIEAKNKGYALPSGFEAKWLDYQKRAAQNWRPLDEQSGNPYYSNSTLMQAYRLYTLALAGQPDLGAMNRLRERSGLGDAAKWRLAAAYALSGQRSTATQLISNASTSVPEYTELSYTYGSDTRDLAMIIETLAILNERQRALPLVEDLAKRIGSFSWYSTQSTAYSLLAMAKFAGGETQRQLKFSYTLNGKTSAEQFSQKAIMQIKLDGKSGLNSLEVKNLSGNVLFTRIVVSGKPLIGEEKDASSGLSMSVSYMTMSGTPLDPSSIEQGTDFYVEVTISHNGITPHYEELALTQVFPAGWEIINSRMDLSAVVMASDQPEYQDFRDDRVLSYFDLWKSKSKTFRVKLNASYLGRFYLPGTYCEAMYDKTINASQKGRWVNVVPAGQTAAR